jgi:hypothetical protein
MGENSQILTVSNKKSYLFRFFYDISMLFGSKYH